MSSLGCSGTALWWLRVTLAVPVSVATLPIGSSDAAGWVEAAAGEAGAGEGAGGGEGCACASRVGAAVALNVTDEAALLSTASASAAAIAGVTGAKTSNIRPRNRRITDEGVSRAMSAFDPRSRGVINEKNMP